MAVILVITLISLILIYISINVRTLHNLGRELKRIDQHQVRRLQARTAVSNAPAATRILENTSWTVSPPSANR